MHPGDHSGHVIDLGIELTNVINDEFEKIKPNHDSYQQVFQFLTKE